MRQRRSITAILIAVLLFSLADAPRLQAQEGPEPAFGPQDVLPLFFRSLATADILIFDDGTVASARIQNSQFTINSPTFGERSFGRTEVTAIVFGDGERGAPDQLFLRTGELLTGTLQMQRLEAELVLSQPVALDPSGVKAALFRLPPEGGPVPFGPVIQRTSRQIFGLFSELILSVTRFDTLVFPDGRIASVTLIHRESLSFTLQSSFFGTFTFTPAQIAWVIFGQRTGEPDQLALKNGDRVSGTLTANEDLQGSLTSANIEFTLSKERLAAELRQVIFQFPVRLFGSGGGRPRSPEED
jgi:hypothetical protein